MTLYPYQSGERLLFRKWVAGSGIAQSLGPLGTTATPAFALQEIVQTDNRLLAAGA